MKLLIGCTNLNTKPVTELYLKTLTEALKRVNQDIKVVVNIWGKEDNCIELKDKFPFVKFLEHDELGTCAQGWNNLIKEAYDDSGNCLFDYVLIMGNDVYWTENSLNNFINALYENKDKEIGYISFMGNDFKELELTGISETLQVEARYWGSLRTEADDVIDCEQLENVIKATYAPFGGIEKFADNLSKKYGNKVVRMHQKAFGFALSKNTIERVGLFDEYGDVAGLHEDADYGKRLELKGIKTAFVPGAYLHHLSMMTRTKGDFKKEWWIEAREKAFKEKWGVSSKEMDKIPKDKKFKLDIGGRLSPQKGPQWMHMEMDKRFSHMEYIYDCSKPFMQDDDEFEEILCHNAEEIKEQNMALVLVNWRSKLRKNGVIRIYTSDMWSQQKLYEFLKYAGFINITYDDANHIVKAHKNGINYE